MPSGIKVKEVMKRNVIVIAPKDTIKKAADIMAKNKIGSIIVAEKQRPIGILTDTDILRGVVAKGKDPKKTKAESVMKRPLIIVRPEDDIDDAGRKMARNAIRRLPVVDSNGTMVGILSDKDLMFIYPNIVDILKERVELRESVDKMPRPIEEKTTTGLCDNCGKFTTELFYGDEGNWTCDECRTD